MIQNLNSTIITMIILGAPTLILIMLLPALIELKKPKDAGPRMIMGNTFEMQKIMDTMPIVNIEEELKFDGKLVEKLALVIGALPSLET